MALFQSAVLKKYLSGKYSLFIEAEWMEFFNQQKAHTDAHKFQIAHTDREIDGMVYELCGLTGEKVRVVEGVGN